MSFFLSAESRGASLDPDGQPADKIAAKTFQGLHQPLTETDAAGQTTTYVYNSTGQFHDSKRQGRNHHLRLWRRHKCPTRISCHDHQPAFNGFIADHEASPTTAHAESAR